MKNQYFDLWPSETGLPFHIFVGDKTLVSGKPHILIPTEDQLLKSSFSLAECRFISLIDINECAATAHDMLIKDYLSVNRAKFLSYHCGDISITELKSSLSLEVIK